MKNLENLQNLGENSGICEFALINWIGLWKILALKYFKSFSCKAGQQFGDHGQLVMLGSG